MNSNSSVQSLGVSNKKALLESETTKLETEFPNLSKRRITTVVEEVLKEGCYLGVREILDLEHRHFTYYARMGLHAYEEGCYREARDFYKAAAEIDHEVEALRYNRALCFLKLDQVEEAFRQIESICSHNSCTRSNMIYALACFYQEGRIKEGIQRLQGTRLEPGDKKAAAAIERLKKIVESEVNNNSIEIQVEDYLFKDSFFTDEKVKFFKTINFSIENSWEKFLSKLKNLRAKGFTYQIGVKSITVSDQASWEEFLKVHLSNVYQLNIQAIMEDNLQKPNQFIPLENVNKRALLLDTFPIYSIKELKERGMRPPKLNDPFEEDESFGQIPKNYTSFVPKQSPTFQPEQPQEKEMEIVERTKEESQTALVNKVEEVQVVEEPSKEEVVSSDGEEEPLSEEGTVEGEEEERMSEEEESLIKQQLDEAFKPIVSREQITESKSIDQSKVVIENTGKEIPVKETSQQAKVMPTGTPTIEEILKGFLDLKRRNIELEKELQLTKDRVKILEDDKARLHKSLSSFLNSRQ